MITRTRDDFEPVFYPSSELHDVLEDRSDERELKRLDAGDSYAYFEDGESIAFVLTGPMGTIKTVCMPDWAVTDDVRRALDALTYDPQD
jgi:hypothetical protein